MMNLTVPRRRFDPGHPEMIDRADHEPGLLEKDLKNLRAINRFFGGYSVVKDFLAAAIERISPSATIDILDLATGSGDHPVEIAKFVQKKGRAVRIVAVEKNPQTLKVAQRWTKGHPEISILQGDLLQLDFTDKSFDIVLCSLALHHFSNEEALFVVREMNRLSRVAFIVNDLHRSWVGAWTTWLYTHATTRNPLTLHDSTLSVLRAFTPEELRDMAFHAGVQNFEILRRPFFRLILVGKHWTE